MQTSQSGQITSITANGYVGHVLKSVTTALALVLFLAACGGGGGTATSAGKALTSQRFVSVAENAGEYKQIFGKLPTTSQESAISKILAQAKQQGLTIVRPAGSKAAAEFESAYLQSSADVITLVGHNKQGLFKFSDGSYFPLDQIRPSDDVPVLAVISCESAPIVEGYAVGLPTEVTYAIAFRTEEVFLQRLNALDESSRRDLPTLQVELEAALDVAVIERNVKVFKYALVGTGSGTVVGVSIYQVANQ